MRPSGEVPDALVGGVSIDKVLEMVERDEVQQLREHRAAVIHDAASFARENGKDTVKNRLAISNRRNLESRRNPRHCLVSIN
jgi:hypothetical protein